MLRHFFVYIIGKSYKIFERPPANKRMCSILGVPRGDTYGNI